MICKTPIDVVQSTVGILLTLQHHGWLVLTERVIRSDPKSQDQLIKQQFWVKWLLKFTLLFWNICFFLSGCQMGACVLCRSIHLAAAPRENIINYRKFTERIFKSIFNPDLLNSLQ